MKYQLIKPINKNYSVIQQILTNRGIPLNNINNYLYTTDGAAAGSSSFKVGASTTSNLQVTASSNQISLGLVWGTF